MKMDRVGPARKFAAAAVLASAAAAAAPSAAYAQTVTCAPGTAVMVRAVGSPRAPMLVPAQVPVNICSQNGQVVGVIPAFQTIGPSGAPGIVPVQTLVRNCAPAVMTSVPLTGGPLSSPLEFSQVAAVIPSTIVTATPVFTCF
jgi:hypothetical protein